MIRIEVKDVDGSIKVVGTCLKCKGGFHISTLITGKKQKCGCISCGGIHNVQYFKNGVVRVSQTDEHITSDEIEKALVENTGVLNVIIKEMKKKRNEDCR